MNGEKTLIWKVLTVLITIVLGLVSTIWGIQSGNVRKNERCIATNIEKIVAIEKFEAGQAEINKSTEKRLESIEMKLDKILDELRKK